MTTREMLEHILNICDSDNIETIFSLFLDRFQDNLSINTINSLRKEICFTLDNKIENLERARCISKENAWFIKTYLEGNMWKDEESAKANLQPQIENAQAIIDVCGKVK